jgi:hypothetical protein
MYYQRPSKELLMRNLHVFLLAVILFGAGTVGGAYIQYHRDITKPAPPSHCFLVYNGTIPEQLRPFIPGASGSQRYEVYAC